MLLQAVLAGATPTPTPDRFYMSQGDALLHAARKTAISGLAYAGLRKLGVGRTLSGVLASVGPWAIGAGIEAAKGHRQSLGDKIHDLGWHSAAVLPLATRKGWTALIPLGTIALTRRHAAPGW